MKTNNGLLSHDGSNHTDLSGLQSLHTRVLAIFIFKVLLLFGRFSSKFAIKNIDGRGDHKDHIVCLSFFSFLGS